MPEPRNPEVREARKYDRELGYSTEVGFYHAGLPISIELLTRTQAEALLHQLESHLYGGVDRAGYTKLAPNQVVVTLSPEAMELMRHTRETLGAVSTDVVVNPEPQTPTRMVIPGVDPLTIPAKECDCDD